MGLKVASVGTTRAERPKISLCMIMKDEQEHLPRCLRSVEGVVDEIVIVDTGSTDRSVEIAEGFGANVLHEEWTGDFALHRNTSIDAASGDWILVLDADEELIDGQQIHELVRSDDLEGFCLREVNFIGEQVGVECVVNSAFRLFRNRPEYRYEGALHEQIMGKVDPEGGVTTRFVGVEIHHYGYLDPTTVARKKTDRNMAIVMDEVRRKPKDSFTLFNAGVEYQRIGDHETAIDYFRRSFATLPSLRAYYASLLLRNIIASLNSLERYDEALDVLADALQAYPDFTDLHYLQGQLHLGRREYRAAIRGFRRAIELGDHAGDRYMAQAGMGSFYSWHALGGLYEMMGDVHEAVRCYKSAITSAKGFYAAPIVKLASLALETDPADEVERYVVRLIGERRRADSLRVLAQVFLQKGHPERALSLAAQVRELEPEDSTLAILEADCHLAAGDAAAARAALEAIAPASDAAVAARGKRVLVEIVAGDHAAAARAAAELDDVADGLYGAAYAISVRALAGEPAGDPPEQLERGAVLEVVLELASTLLRMARLEEFNALVPVLYALAPDHAQLDQRLGFLFFENDFPDPAADRLLAAVQADVATPDAYAALGRICQVKEMHDDAEAFLREALARDAQSLGRYLDLASHVAGSGRYLDATEVLREGLLVYPHSNVLRELRESLTLLAGAPA